jgi:hypothetical protein
MEDPLGTCDAGALVGEASTDGGQLAETGVWVVGSLAEAAFWVMCTSNPAVPLIGEITGPDGDCCVRAGLGECW